MHPQGSKEAREKKKTEIAEKAKKAVRALAPPSHHKLRGPDGYNQEDQTPTRQMRVFLSCT
jgi:hypothetical protein